MELQIKKIISEINKMPLEKKIETINYLKAKLHEVSPFKNEPVDCVLWVKNDIVKANDYNPNVVAPPEMELLKVSISNDGYTQPIVTFPEKKNYTVIDGFHRKRVGTEIKEIEKRVMGYLPITIIRPESEERGNRIASTIRHNRARGKHTIVGMSDIILELKRRNWSDKKIGKQLGMQPDEVLRLAQITGLAEMFKDKEFSEAWEADTSKINENDNLEIELENPENQTRIIKLKKMK